MKILTIKYFVPLLLLITSVSCEFNADLVDAPPFKQELVVTAFISPSDKISYFRVISNKKIFGELNTEEPLGLLSGFISDGKVEVALDTCRFGLMLNHEKMQIGYGKKYKLRVSSENGLKAEAECTVPLRRHFLIETDTFSVIKESTDYSPYPHRIYRSINLKAKFTDMPGEDNFYRIFGTLRGYSRYSRLSGEVIFDTEFLSDAGMDGKSIVSNMDEQISEFLSMADDSLFINIYLFNIEKSYFRYHKSMMNYVSGEDPFTEATPMYSNISGGLGVFTSYTIDSLLIRLK
jgi:hypothetical protein